jgi:hypothetical protein
VKLKGCHSAAFSFAFGSVHFWEDNSGNLAFIHGDLLPYAMFFKCGGLGNVKQAR